MNNKKYVYFLYSEEQFQEKNKILGKMGKSFSAGTVVVNGKRKKFTQISDKPSLDRFIDTEVIYEGYLDSVTYTKPVIGKKKGN